MAKRKTTLIAAGLLVAVFCGGVLAQVQPPPRPSSPSRDSRDSRPDPRMEQAVDMMFQDMDTNRDGKISKKEWMAAQERQFNNLDRNRDGSITKDEVLSDMQQRMRSVQPPPESSGRGAPPPPQSQY